MSSAPHAAQRHSGQGPQPPLAQTHAPYGPTSTVPSSYSHASVASPVSSSAHGSSSTGPGSSAHAVAIAETQPLRPARAAPHLPGGVILDDEDLDDELHRFGPDTKKDLEARFTFNTLRGWVNAFTLFVLLAGFVVLFAGYPIIDWAYGNNNSSGGHTSGFNLGGVNASGQYPEIPGFPQLIDTDTPSDAYTRVGQDGNQWELVFSDEFNKDGRTFYPGDDPFFTAVDLHYWPTNDFEWYDPGQITTQNGSLVITMEQRPLNNLMFRSGMLQSWNQLCFNKNAYFEVSVSLPGKPRIGGFWPGIWTMGNLGRPGYGASTDGLWPYSYTACDVGILPNQTKEVSAGVYDPAGNEDGGDVTSDNPQLSFLPGQRLSSCNCPGSGDHPGPTGVGRGAVEIDLIEAQTDQTRGVGTVSQSAQVAPFDLHYEWTNTSTSTTIDDPSKTIWNTYLGGVYQQAISGLTDTCDDCDSDPYEYYQQGDGKFAMYGFEYVANVNDRSKGYIQWYALGKPSWRMNAEAIGANSGSKISQRLVSEEPMALIFNFGMSNNFENVNFGHLTFPNQMLIDYIRVYQLPGTDGTVGCDPPDRPTAAYIAKYPEVYNNPNLTTWTGAGYTFPRNQMTGC